MLTGITRGAEISDCGRFRWTLTRSWDESLPVLLVWMLNPSDASAEIDDPTVTLVCHIAAHNGFGGIVVVNLCPLRSPQPEAAFAMFELAQELRSADREILWKNFSVIDQQLARATAVLAAWGAMGERAGDWVTFALHKLRDSEKRVYHLGLCANGHPKHPLARGVHRVPKDAPLIPWSV